jgi:hypothetical protein
MEFNIYLKSFGEIFSFGTQIDERGDYRQKLKRCVYYEMTEFSKKEVISRVINLPTDVYVQNKSSVQLLVESGYDKRRTQINPEDLEQELLCSAPNTIESWQTYSDNKRTTSGWYIRRIKMYEVGYYSNGNNVNVTYFEHWHQALADFIKHELEELLAAHQ